MQNTHRHSKERDAAAAAASSVFFSARRAFQRWEILKAAAFLSLMAGYACNRQSQQKKANIGAAGARMELFSAARTQKKIIHSRGEEKREGAYWEINISNIFALLVLAGFNF